MSNQYDSVPDSVVDLEINQGPKIDTTGMSHKDKIKMACEATGVVFTEPRSTCNKCSGKGYIGVRQNDGEAIPCPCVLRNNSKEFKEETKIQSDMQYKLNRKQRRQQQKMLNKIRRLGNE